MSEVKRGGRGRLVAAVAVIIIIVAIAGVYYFFSTIGTTPIKIVTVTVPSGTGTNSSLNFTPQTIVVVINVNNTIEWVNQDRVAHTVTSTSVPSGASSFDSPLPVGSTVTITLKTPGTYQYHCTVHPAYMIGTIIVKSS